MMAGSTALSPVFLLLWWATLVNCDMKQHNFLEVEGGPSKEELESVLLDGDDHTFSQRSSADTLMKSIHRFGKDLSESVLLDGQNPTFSQRSSADTLMKSIHRFGKDLSDSVLLDEIRPMISQRSSANTLLKSIHRFGRDAVGDRFANRFVRDEELLLEDILPYISANLNKYYRHHIRSPHSPVMSNTKEKRGDVTVEELLHLIGRLQAGSADTSEVKLPVLRFTSKK